MTKKVIFICFILITISSGINAQKPGWAPTPPMGWNSWNTFGQGINEKLIMDIADAMVSSGMKDAGYEYVVIDDGWELGWSKSAANEKVSQGRDVNGTILVDSVKFPHGIKYLADYIHSKGLKFGIYTAPGLATCGGHTGSEGYEEKDVNTFAEWGVDFIKLDWCGCEKEQRGVLTLWREALNKASRPIVLSLNPNDYSSYLSEYADMWRTTTDITCGWMCNPYKFKIFPGVYDVLVMHTYCPIKQSPSGWNDADMLQVANCMSFEENKSHFSMWAMFGAPLLAGNDLRKMSPDDIKVLTNREVISVDQDPLGQEGVMIKGEKYGSQLWGKKLQKYSDYAVLLLNNGKDSADMTFNYTDLGLKGPVFLRDLWNHKDLGLYKTSYKVKVPSHGVVMLKVTANENPVQMPEFQISDLPLGIIIEAEEAFEFQDGYITNTVKRFTGTGYVMGQNHEWAGFNFSWKYMVPEKGNYKITVRYYNPGNEAVSFTISDGKLLLLPCKKDKWGLASTTFTSEKGFQLLYLGSDSSKKNTVAVDNMKFERID
jgi:alpha-galactosidase